MYELDLYQDPSAEWELDYIKNDLLSNYQIKILNPWIKEDIDSRNNINRKVVITGGSKGIGNSPICRTVRFWSRYQGP